MPKIQGIKDFSQFFYFQIVEFFLPVATSDGWGVSLPILGKHLSKSEWGSI